MPISARAFEREIKSAGYFIVRTARGHFNVLNAAGQVICNYAVGHGRSKNEVLDCYLRNVRRAIIKDKSNE